MEFLIRYIKKYIVSIAFFLICCSIAPIVMILYGSPTFIIEYSIILCLSVGLIYGGICAYRGFDKEIFSSLYIKVPSSIFNSAPLCSRTDTLDAKS